MKKLFFLLLVACVLSVAVPGMSLSAETRTDTATESGDAEVFVDDSDRFTAFEEELLSRYAGRGIRSGFTGTWRWSPLIAAMSRPGRSNHCPSGRAKIILGMIRTFLRVVPR